MFRFTRVLSVMALGAFSVSSHAASFDCQKAASFVEKAVCQDALLSALDEKLSAAFDKAISQSSNPNALKKQEMNWLKTKRGRCQDNACLEKVYSQRIVELSQAGSGTSNAGIGGEYERYDANGKPDLQAASITVFALGKGKVKIVGSSTWVGDVNSGNVHVGDVEGSFSLRGNQINYQDQGGCRFILLFGANALTINNDNNQCGGANVSFNGYYKKIK